MEIKLKKLDPRAKIPAYQTDGAAGFDFHCLDAKVIHPGCTELISTGLAVEVPPGYAMHIHSRSGLGAKYSVFMLLGVGIVDCFSEEMRIKTVEGEKKVGDLRITDQIISFNEDTLTEEKDEIEAILNKGVLEVFSIELENGETLEVTPNTQVLTKSGWAYAKDLKEEDEVLLSSPQ